MIIHGTKGVEITVFTADVDVAIVISIPGQEPVRALVTPNHCQALELLVSAARMEAEARGRGE